MWCHMLHTHLAVLDIISTNVIRSALKWLSTHKHLLRAGSRSQTPLSVVSQWVMQMKVAVRTPETMSKLHMAPACWWAMRRLVVPALGAGGLEANPQVALGWVAAAPWWAGRGRCWPALPGSSSALTAAVLVCVAME